ncbi:lipase [Russula earlei]|uniref:Lipase n=1 Tax=Russula earlei TaxID=71964 RepID=A0ACC0UGB4_9AGAM|nr:lipase [Russula earlei]
MICLRSLFALASIGLAHAAVYQRQAISTLSSTQIDAFAPFTHFASTAYCNPSTTINWSCGANCDANPDFQPVISGGDGSGTQFYYVGFSPSLSSVIVAHQGTDPQKLLADLTDLDFFPEPLDPSLFPGVPSTVAAHSGFANEHAKTAQAILTAVQDTLTAQGASSVTVVGHSLGAALALLDGVSLSLQLSPGVTVNVIGYGMPRVGNQDFANFVDSRLGGLVTHVNNQDDPVPTVPGRFLGFHHASGEIHIQDSGDWDACPGQDNPSDLCIVGDVTNILDSNVNNHLGPYAGITMGC